MFLEDLNVQGLLELPSNRRNILLVSWFETIQTFERHGRKNGCHVLKMPLEGTTKWYADCSVESRKPLWVREHSCPSCGFEADRDQNAAWNVQKLGLEDLGVKYEKSKVVGLDEAESMPVETALPVDSDPALVLSNGTTQ
jgi:putative transposase